MDFLEYPMTGHPHRLLYEVSEDFLGFTTRIPESVAIPPKSPFAPRKTPTQARAKQTWNAILDAAAQVLLRHGYDRSTTDRIAERAGVSVGSVYEYFPNKEAIFASLLLRWNEKRWRVFLETLGEIDGDLEQTIRTTVRARIRATRIDPALNTALLRELPPKVTGDQSREIHDAFLATSLRTLGRFASEERNQELMAELMIHATHAVIENLAATSPALLDSQELEDELTRMMVRFVEI